jgi:hypothetical protein
MIATLAGTLARQLIRDLPALIRALAGTLAPMPPLPRGHQGPAPFMRARSQAKRRRLARRRTS